MACDKRTYESFGEAQEMLNKARNFQTRKVDGRRMKRRQPPYKPKRAYKCDLCGLYHLTSMTGWKKQKA